MKNEDDNTYQRGCHEVKNNMCKICDTSQDSINVIIIITMIFSAFVSCFYIVTEITLINTDIYIYIYIYISQVNSKHPSHKYIYNKTRIEIAIE